MKLVLSVYHHISTLPLCILYLYKAEKGFNFKFNINKNDVDVEVMVAGRWVKPHQPSSIKDSLPLWQHD